MITFFTACKEEPSVCKEGVQASLFYTRACATINGHIILEETNEILVFKHEVGEEFQQLGMDVCVVYEMQEDEPLTAECMQGPIIIITTLIEI